MMLSEESCLSSSPWVFLRTLWLITVLSNELGICCKYYYKILMECS
ncbi:unnamed protein product [Arabidopsis halleri]